MDGFSVRIVTARDQALVLPTGELDLAAARELEAAVGVALDGHKELVVDLRGVTFLDTEGLKSLVEAAGVAAERHVTFRPAPERTGNLLLDALPVDDLNRLLDGVAAPVPSLSTTRSSHRTPYRARPVPRQWSRLARDVPR